MSNQKFDSQCWYKIINDKFKVEGDQVRNLGIVIDQCVDCKFSITSNSYQQLCCGSRYCKECFEKLENKYYCSVCKEENAEDYVHKRDDIFVDKAMIRDLEKIKITCPDCKVDLRLIGLEEHVKSCEYGWYLCNDCQIMFKKGSLHSCPVSSSEMSDFVQGHKHCDGCGKLITKGKHECAINWTKCCPYGCEEVGQDLELHRLENVLNHLDKCGSIMKELNLFDFKGNKESFSEQPWLKYINKKLESELSFHPKDIGSVIDEVSSLNKEMTEEINIIEIIRESFSNQLLELQNTSFDGTITWRIDNFDKVKKDAIDGVQKSIFSPPFYTSRFGYKMCLRLYPNGDATAHGIAMSLFLVIMKGNYDAILKWPFKQKVTFILCDPDFKTNWIDAFIPSENTPSFTRPRTDMNIPSGSSYFIKFEDMNLNEQGYAKNNVVFIRCIVDCSDIPA